MCSFYNITEFITLVNILQTKLYLLINEIHFQKLFPYFSFIFLSPPPFTSSWHLIYTWLIDFHLPPRLLSYFIHSRCTTTPLVAFLSPSIIKNKPLWNNPYWYFPPSYCCTTIVTLPPPPYPFFSSSCSWRKENSTIWSGKNMTHTYEQWA